MASFPVPSGAKFLFIGDSITDCDRNPTTAPLGWGYVQRFSELVTFHHPELDIRWLNRGIGGDVIGDLRRRWDEDCVAHRPDWLAVMIGVNDCHGNIEGEVAWAAGEYEEAFRDLLNRVQPFTPSLVLLDPFYVTSADGRWPVDDFQRRILHRIAAYQRVVAGLAREFCAVHVRVQDLFNRQLRHRPPTFFGPEPVHPIALGHAMIALELYEQLAGPADEDAAQPTGPVATPPPQPAWQATLSPSPQADPAQTSSQQEAYSREQRRERRERRQRGKRRR
jgi:lysophospholipase L1-like esterase